MSDSQLISGLSRTFLIISVKHCISIRQITVHVKGFPYWNPLVHCYTLIYIGVMRTRNTCKTSSKRDPNKRLLGAWVDQKLYQDVKWLSDERGHGNASVVVTEALTDYLRRANAQGG